MKAALAILLILIGGFLIYEVLSGNSTAILTNLKNNQNGITTVQPGGNVGGGAEGSF